MQAGAQDLARVPLAPVEVCTSILVLSRWRLQAEASCCHYHGVCGFANPDLCLGMLIQRRAELTRTREKRKSTACITPVVSLTLSAAT